MLTAQSSSLQHLAQNWLLLCLSLLFSPFTTFAVVCSHIIGIFHNSPINHRKLFRSPRTPYIEPKTILVTGVGMTKGLALARLFYAAGHNVIGADFEPWYLPTACGHLSRSIKTFYKLEKPDGTAQKSARYAQGLLDIIRKEKVHLWVSCSGVASAVDDGRAKEMIESVTSCKSIQYDVKMTQTLHEKHSFIELTRSFGLDVPESHSITSKAAALKVLEDARKTGTKYIMKYTGTDDSVRGDMTLLPFKLASQTLNHINKLSISESRPWILQQYIKGPEYCTHALIVNNNVRAFVSCPSAELLMHYEAVPQGSALDRSMLKFTQDFAAACPPGFTGHLSFDFMVDQADHDAAVRGKLKTVPLWPIECNPRAHTAVVLFSDTPEMIAKGYMSVFDPPPSPEVDRHGKRRLNGHKTPQPVYPNKPEKYYWLPHDLWELVISPSFDLLKVDGVSFTELLGRYSTFVEHVCSWRDGTFEIWDPLPAWWLWHVSWPYLFVKAAITGSKWSRINVSTMKVFEC